MTVRLVSNAKIAETSSKGNQEKWLDHARWYKLDQFGYEALTETVTSMLLERSNIEGDTPFQFARYRMERLHVHGRDRTGCSSENFLKTGQAIVTLSHLFRQHLGHSLKEALKRLTSDKKRIAYLAEETAALTGLQEFPEYLTLLFEIDSLVLNDDRHLNNIAVIEQNGRYAYCPIFDQGAGLLSNVQFSPMDIATPALIRALRARPFNMTFNRQLHTAQELYGKQLRLPRFTRDELMQDLRPLLEYYASRDRGLIADRVCDTILMRQKEL
ncbi:MAG: hypothetical protein IJ357_08290 [Oscillospiraceae bacterium]|nr:hypothetical protein [Oscillospiraceae bacterium]